MNRPNHYLYIILLLILSLSCQKSTNQADLIETQPPLLKANTKKVNDAIGGFYSALPLHYSETQKQYPLLIFLHGGGQIGNGNTELPYVLNEGVPELINYKKFPPAFKVNGQYFSFIMLAPQFSRYPSTNEVENFISYAVENYRVDKKRIYLSGLSMGGIVTADVGADFAGTLAAIVPISGVSNTNDNSISQKCRSIAAGKLPVWVFQNDSDQVANIGNANNYISLINNFHPPVVPKFTRFLPWGLNNHDAWTRATDPYYKEDNMNMYEWMLQYTR